MSETSTTVTEPRSFFVPMQMPNLNDVIEACKTHYAVYAKLKRKWGSTVALCARAGGFTRIQHPAHFSFEFREPDRRRDPDNLIAGGLKVIFDAMQDAGLLHNDGWNDVLSITTSWRVDKERPGVMLTVREEQKARATTGRKRVQSVKRNAPTSTAIDSGRDQDSLARRIR